MLPILKPVLGLLLGALVGFGVSKISGAAGGGCPLTCNPYLASGMGALIGLLLSLR